MASLIPGFEYDIFISYRQKDNKQGGWVTEFVDALKTELEATFKEDISVYFDENPHQYIAMKYFFISKRKKRLLKVNRVINPKNGKLNVLELAGLN